MQGRELEKLIAQVLADAGHPRIEKVTTLLDRRGEDSQVGVAVTDTDGSEGLVLTVQVTQGGRRLHSEQFDIPKEMR